MSRDANDLGRILVVDHEGPVRDVGPDLAAVERALARARRALPAAG